MSGMRASGWEHFEGPRASDTEEGNETSDWDAETM
jgi:hypothetical protein